MSESQYFAAIDLGSNSFHMIIGRLNNGQIEIVDREKEMVQIARGLSDSGKIDDESKQRALDCLHRFSERLRDIPSSQIRAVGTKTLRAAKDGNAFLRQAEQQLGQPIHIISGYEEARLVYCGLSNQVTNDNKQRLVIDIGGGSTEFVIGKDYDPIMLESLGLGCVSFTKKYFDSSKTFAECMNKAYMAACTEMEEIRKFYTKKGWEIAYGTSGTMKAIGGIINNAGSIIDYDSLTQLMQDTMKAGNLDHTDIPKLRRDVLPAGIAILKAIFDQLKIDNLYVSDATLKEGVIYDTVGRFSDADTREITVVKLMQRYSIDDEQASRVRLLALNLWGQVKDEQPNLIGIARTKALKWACNLHEIGLSLSHSGYHHHSYYLLKHGDLAGFGRFEQYVIALLVRCHRKKIPVDDILEFNESIRPAFIALLLCFRLSILFNRRRENFESKLHLRYKKNQFILNIDNQWLNLNPLTRAGLLAEISMLSQVSIELVLEEK